MYKANVYKSFSQSKKIVLGLVSLGVIFSSVSCSSGVNVESSTKSTNVPSTSSVDKSPANDTSENDVKNYNEKIPAERDLKILQYAGSSESKIMRRMTLQQGKTLLDDLAKIHPDFYKVRTLGWARSVCGDILQGKDEAYILKVMPTRFGASSTRIIGPNESQQILDVIKANGFCQKP